MKRFLLDTNVISEVRRLRPHGAVLAWIASLREEQIFLSAVTLGELQSGIERTRRQGQKAEEIEKWVDQLAQSLQVLPMDGACFRVWGQLMEGKPEQIVEDGMIAATAMVHGLTVATRKERDFAVFAVPVVNPFRPSGRQTRLQATSNFPERPNRFVETAFTPPSLHGEVNSPLLAAQDDHRVDAGGAARGDQGGHQRDGA